MWNDTVLHWSLRKYNFGYKIDIRKDENLKGLFGIGSPYIEIDTWNDTVRDESANCYNFDIKIGISKYDNIKGLFGVR